MTGSACRDSFPFAHLTLAEVAEFGRLAAAIKDSGQAPPGYAKRFTYLASRRHRPLYDPETPDEAA